jgi:hypothetical protein
MKLKAVWRYVLDCPSEVSHIVFADAYDVLFAAGIDEIIQRFETFDSPIVFSAEKNCVPDRYRRPMFPSHSSPYRFLNSGFWVGRRKELQEMFSRIEISSVPDGINDQRVFTDLFLFGKCGISLDYSTKLCHNLFLSEEDLTYYPSKGRVQNSITKAFPTVFHGNGKSDMSQLIDWLQIGQPKDIRTKTNINMVVEY